MVTMAAQVASSFAFSAGYPRGSRPVASSLIQQARRLHSAPAAPTFGGGMGHFMGKTNALSTALSSDVGVGFNLPSADVQIALFTVFCACLPYLLNLFFPKLVTKLFFIPVYKTPEKLQEEGRPKEDWDAGQRVYIYWECMYAVLGLALVSVSYVDAFVAPKERLLGDLQSFAGSSDEVFDQFDAIIGNLLRDDIVMWALFYVAAFIKILIENKNLIIVADNGKLIGIQVWHFLVASVLLACVATPPLGPFLLTIRNLLKLD
jgi:hypothetical protein